MSDCEEKTRYYSLIANRKEIREALDVSKKYISTFELNQKDYNYKYENGILGCKFYIKNKISSIENKLNSKVENYSQILEGCNNKITVFDIFLNDTGLNNKIRNIIKYIERLERAKKRIIKLKNNSDKIDKFVRTRLLKFQPDVINNRIQQNKN